jgi:hypothetical protein
MRVQIRWNTPGLTPEALTRIERRIHFTLGRFGDRIRRVGVWIQDENGPRGGVDQRCWVEVELRPKGRVHARAFGVDPLMAVTGASRRAGRRVRDELNRQRVVKRRGASPLAPAGKEST